MDKFKYFDILNKNLKSFAKKLQILPVYYFQQDNDPEYKSYVVKKWLFYIILKRLKLPPHSPDINPIEHLLQELKSKLSDCRFSSK